MPKVPKLAEVLKAYDAAIKLFQRGNYTQARDAFEAIGKKYPNQSDIVARVGQYLDICRQRLGTPPKLPQTPESLYNRGIVEMNNARFEEAIDFFKRALKSDPQMPHVLYSLAAAQVRSGATEEGLRTLERAVEGREIHRSHARNDSDFAELRSDARFQELVGLTTG